jgi:hypothetical protein
MKIDFILGKASGGIALRACLVAAALFPSVACADFKGTDAFKEPNHKWREVAVGGGSLVVKNGRLEFLVAKPSTFNTASFLWVRNQGRYDQDWFVEVGAHMDKIPLKGESGAMLSLSVGNVPLEGDKEHALGLMPLLNRTGGRYGSSVWLTDENGMLNESRAFSRDTTLRVHFDSTAKTLTGSYKTAKGWKYFAPVNIADWKLRNSATFYTYLTGANGGDSTSGLGLGSGSLYFSNFKAGKAAPEITIEHPATNALVEWKSDTNFGKSNVGKQKSALRFTVRNTGTALLKGLSIVNKGTHAADFIVTPTTLPDLPPGALATFNVSFKPTAIGVRHAAIQVRSNAPHQSRFNVSVHGTGTN